ARLAEAAALLERLGATRGGVLSEVGRALARIPAPPRIARLLFEGARRGVLERAALAAALLAERDPFLREHRGPHTAQRRAHASFSDVLDRVRALEDFEHENRVHSEVG